MIQKLTLLLTLTGLSLVAGCSKQPLNIEPQIGAYTAQTGTVVAYMELGVSLNPVLAVYDNGSCTFSGPGTCTHNAESPDYVFTFDGISGRATFTASDAFTFRVLSGTKILTDGPLYFQRSK